MPERHVTVEELSAGTETDPLDPLVVDRLHELDFVRVTRRGGGKAWVEPRRKVGSVHVRGVQVTVRPKLPVRRLLFLLGYAKDPRWRDDDVDCAEDQEVIPAVADALARQLARAFASGVPQEYRTVEDVSTVLRGRLRTSAQVSRRLGGLTPLEVEYDEYDVDTPRNRVLATAVRAALQVPGLRDATRDSLRREAALLERVPALSPRDPLPTRSRGDRRSPYDDAVRLALVLLAGRSIEARAVTPKEGLPTAAFTVDMWRVFEDFVGAALTDAARSRLTTTRLNRKRPLDHAELIDVRPDVLWLSGTHACAVADVKYKSEMKSGHPNEDVYQVLAYCLSLGLKRGHLVYARGNATPAVYRVGDITVEAHALDLDTQAAQLRAQVTALSDRILGHGTHGAA